MADTDKTDDAAAEKAYAAAAAEKAAEKTADKASNNDGAAVVTVKVEKPAPPAKRARVAAKPAPEKAPRKPVVAKPIPESKKVVARASVKPSALIAKLKETKMATTTKKTAEDLSARVQGAVKEAQDRAKTALGKGQALLADVGEFTKGNIEAMAESGKILRTGVQAIGKTYVESAKSAFGDVRADVEELRAVKSPTEFVNLQSTLVRKYFDTAVENNAKRTEAALKLANEAMKPLSDRVAIARERVKKAA